MTQFRKCTNCVLEKQPCERRETVRKGIAGLGVTSVKMRCADRRPIYSVGQRVNVCWKVQEPDGEGGYTEETWPATVIRESGCRFIVKVDDVMSDYESLASEVFNNKSLYIKARVGQLSPINEPHQIVCGECGRVGTGPTGSDGCYAYVSTSPFAPHSYRPRGCVAPTDEPAVAATEERNK